MTSTVALSPVPADEAALPVVAIVSPTHGELHRAVFLTDEAARTAILAALTDGAASGFVPRTQRGVDAVAAATEAFEAFEALR